MSRPGASEPIVAGPGSWLAGAAAALAAAAALWRAGTVARVLRGRGALPRVSRAPDPTGEPLVSVLVPARNEERAIGACLASLRAQRYRRLEILAIDDASTDGTAEVVARAAREDARIRLLRVEGPPAGWTGKNWALASGVARAAGTWLCFTDADTVHAPESVSRALGFAQARGLGLLSMTSRQITVSPWERIVQPVVFGLLDQWFPLARVNDPGSALAAANGIFILAPREAYEAAGGHRAVAGEILEDVALARNVKRSGRRIAFADGADLVAARMYTSLGAIRRGWTKNLFALRGRRLGLALASAADLVLTGPWPPLAGAALWLGGHAGLAGIAGAATLLTVGAEAVFRRRRGFPPGWSATWPLGAGLVAALLLESAARVRLGLGVDWKARRYTWP